ncbi:hypothetical protein WD019_13785 [Fictibacillus sp. Mic-4]|uniref:hypothetical protein n=1 Tax=Fictibacillus sp. Mic-4 TaxID=3132826 RepID=UPI003CE772A2
MKIQQVEWPLPVRKKLLSFRSKHFTPEETYDFIIQTILETEDILMNPVYGKMYIEETGKYTGFMRLVIRRFRIYVKQIGTKAIVVGVKFPGEK